MITRRGFLGVSVVSAMIASTRRKLFAQGSDISRLLLTTDGLGLAGLVRNGEVTPLELAEAAVHNALALNPDLNAINTPMYERALEGAATMPAQGPFAGVPFSIKDNMDVAGVVSTHGSRLYEDHVPDTSAPLTMIYEAAGLNIMGKTNMPEVGLGCTTEGQLLGACHNPWNLDHSSGGSSGGAAAVVAAGIMPVAHGSDGGGSIRIPASSCGVFGLKPSRRRMIWGSTNQADFAVDHCITRSVRDSAMLFAIGQDRSPTAQFKPIPFVDGPDGERLTIGFDLRNVLGELPDPEVQSAIESTARLLEGLGHQVMEVQSPVDSAFEDHFFTLFSRRIMAIADLAEQKAERPVSESRLLDQATMDFAAAGRTLTAEAVANARAYMDELAATYSQWQTTIDLFLSPVVAAPPPRLGFLFDPELEFDVLYRRVFDYLSYTPVQNTLGVPAMSVPLGMSDTGLPIGSHFVAPAGREDLLYKLAYELEEAKPWAREWPLVSAEHL